MVICEEDIEIRGRVEWKIIGNNEQYPDIPNHAVGMFIRVVAFIVMASGKELE